MSKFFVRENQISNNKIEILDDVMNQNIKQTLTRMNVDNTNGYNLLTEEKMEKFIDKISDIDISSYIEKIKKENKNVFPDNYLI